MWMWFGFVGQKSLWMWMWIGFVGQKSLWMWMWIDFWDVDVDVGHIHKTTWICGCGHIPKSTITTITPPLHTIFALYLHTGCTKRIHSFVRSFVRITLKFVACAYIRVWLRPDNVVHFQIIIKYILRNTYALHPTMKYIRVYR